ncbi:MAG: hypothetical protein KDA45_05250, partial [Planctomycetales bacterium]|nr:hypothetical protein [Planctomycetales bacterium]
MKSSYATAPARPLPSLYPLGAQGEGSALHNGLFEQLLSLPVPLPSVRPQDQSVSTLQDTDRRPGDDEELAPSDSSETTSSSNETDEEPRLEQDANEPEYSQDPSLATLPPPPTHQSTQDAPAADLDATAEPDAASAPRAETLPRPTDNPAAATVEGSELAVESPSTELHGDGEPTASLAESQAVVDEPLPEAKGTVPPSDATDELAQTIRAEEAASTTTEKTEQAAETAAAITNPDSEAESDSQLLDGQQRAQPASSADRDSRRERGGNDRKWYEHSAEPQTMGETSGQPQDELPGQQTSESPAAQNRTAANEANRGGAATQTATSEVELP